MKVALLLLALVGCCPPELTRGAVDAGQDWPYEASNCGTPNRSGPGDACEDVGCLAPSAFMVNEYRWSGCWDCSHGRCDHCGHHGEPTCAGGCFFPIIPNDGGCP